MGKKKKNKKNKITITDYILANKKASRELDLENATGFASTSKVHKSKKSYSRKNYKINYDSD